MVSKTRWWPFDMGGYFGGPFLTFYLFVVIGLGVGWLKGLPRWAYAYLGWALVFAWWWTDMHTYGLKLPGYTFGDEAWGWRIWVPLAAVVVVVVLWTRSLRPLWHLVVGFWQDWTRVSLGGYILLASLILVADENHNPYLLVLMAASTIAMAGGAWAYMRGARAWRRVLALLAGIGLTAVVGVIDEATWDWRAYYGVPAPQGVPPYAEALRVVMALLGGACVQPGAPGTRAPRDCLAAGGVSRAAGVAWNAGDGIANFISPHSQTRFRLDAALSGSVPRLAL
jgi:hypothetical protein